MLRRPVGGEYAPNFETYIRLVQEENIHDARKRYATALQTFYNGLPESKADYAYAPGKWTVKEIIQHLIDTERVFAYRLLRIARNDKTPLAGFDQDHFVQYADGSHRTLSALKAELNAVRTASDLLLESLTETQLQYKGTASGYPTTAHALGFIMYGHLLHHQQIFQERYL